MADLSVLIPIRNAVRPVATQLDRLDQVLATVQRNYEVVLIDDGSSPKAAEGLFQLAGQRRDTRLLRFSQPGGLGPALAAGIAAGNGSEVLAIEAGGRYSVDDIEPMLRRLRRADFVQGKRPRQGLAGWMQRVAAAPRHLVLGRDVRDPSCLFWAARREAVAGMPALCGIEHYLAAYVAMRGYRVDEQRVTLNPVEPSALVDVWPNPLFLLHAWLQRRHTRVAAPCELVATCAPAETLPLAQHAPPRLIAEPPPARKSA